MSALAIERFEPVYLELEPAQITEYGKRYMDRWLDGLERFRSVIRDVLTLARVELGDWGWVQAKLDAEGVPQNIANGIGQATMQKVVDHVNGKTTFTLPAACAMALCTAAPASTSTGATISEATGYTGYGRQTIAGAGWVAATAATPSVGANASTITFGNCTAGTATLLGFAICDSATTGAGVMLWFGGLTSTVISTTQTPPTVAAGALTVSITTSP